MSSGKLPASLAERLHGCGIVVERGEEVAGYLVHYPEIAGLLPRVCAKLRETFDAAELALRVYTDPEIDDRYLSLYVRFPHYAPGVMKHIEAAAAEFDDALADMPGHLLIGTDFRRPRGHDAV